ncbi:Eco57I restriction-modification methylase domain-containing protein [Rosettibacter firmus]|uniref:Eco57I restriction-modification methylase domain-containing protein n=1 Tax=Rosettibacter firmus TaxID=3111522 RepID=UPI00336BC23C
MEIKQILENLIQQFNHDNLLSVLRAKTRTFKQLDEKLSHLDEDQFSDCTLLGEFKVDDELMAVFTAKVNKPLSEKSGKKAQYILGKKFLKNSLKYIGGFFVFYDDKGDFRFSLIYDIPLATGKKDWSNFRRYTYFVSKEQTNKTFIKQFSEAEFTSLNNIIEAFSVEKVTKQFYQEIANWYFWALKNVKFPDDAEAEKNGREISVIRLITRLIFIWFMKVRKLVPDELFNESALKEILTDLKPKNDNYYKAILQNLFFATLNTKQDERRFTSKKKGYKGFSKDFGNHNVYRYEELFKNSEEVIEKYFMPIPFLNGGLFECLDYKTKTRNERKYIDGFTSTKSQQPSVPNFLFFSEDKAIDLNKDYGTTNKKYYVRGIINTLSLYNFTIDESDPNDADVALDPELLGKVFENLLASYNPETAKTARKSTGSYYTPRPIVDYMVDESLKEYFKTHMQLDDIESKLNILFSSEDHSNPFDTEQTKKLVNLIDSLRVVDPAVGSGAFPMRILNRLVFLLHKLDPDNLLWKQSQIDGIKKSVKDVTLQRKFIEETERKFKEKNPDYGRKLYLIEKCIYGVDIQQIAVEIAKLRFFISLLVDEKIENGEIEPLPNLDFKLMQGNSLISSFAGIDFSSKQKNDDNLFDFDERYRQLINEFEELKSQYQNEPDVHKKRKLRDDIDAKLLEIFDEKLKQHYPQLQELERKYAGRKDIIEAEKKKLFKKIGINIDQALQDLIAYTEGRKQKDFFLWDVYFAEVFAEKGGFDIVIGNPPYGNNLNTTEILVLEKKFSKYKFPNKNSAIYFIFIADTILKNQGINSFIVPKSLSYSQGWDVCARFLLSNLFGFYDAGKSFDNVLLEMVVLFKKKGAFFSDYTTGFFDNEKFRIYGLINKRVYHNYKILLTAQSKEEIDLLLKILNNNTSYWGHYVSIERGLNWQSKVESNKGKTPIFRGAQLKKYYLENASDYISLSKFNKSEYLYQLKPKILNQLAIAHVKNPYPHFYLQAYLDLDNKLVFETISCTFLKSEKINVFFLLALNNSKLFAWLLYKFVYNNAIRSTRYDEQYVSKIPCPNLNNVNQKPFIYYAEKILAAKKQNPSADTKHLEDQIDIMVYKLYNLTYEEVKIIDPEIEKIISEKDYEKFEIK